MNNRPMYETAAALMASEISDKVKGLDAVEALKVAFKNAHNHWMFTEEQDQFKGAVGAVLINLKSGPEFDRVNDALRALGKLSALMGALQTGIPVDIEAMLKAQEEDPKVDLIPLNKMWCDVKFGREATV